MTVTAGEAPTGTEFTSAPPGDTPSAAASRRRLPRPGLSIQSKLLIMLLAVSLLSSIVVGVIGYISGRDSLRASAVDQLTTIRELRQYELENALNGVVLGVTLDSRNLSAQTASIAMNEGWEDLQQRQLAPEQQAEVEAWHAETFVPQLEDRTGDAYGATAFVPTSNAGRWAQYLYTSQFTDYDSALATDTAAVATPYTEAAVRYGDYLARLVNAVGYEDVLMLNLSGDVVYSAYKGPDLGTNLNDGPYKDTAFAEAYRAVIATNSVSAVEATDFERWIPSLNVPSIWVVSPIGNDTRITGALAAQIPIDTVNDVLTGDEQWSEQGLGRTGEVYVAGTDHLMRSISREMVESPDDYAEAVIANGTSPTIAERAQEVQGTVLIQPVNTFSVDEALKGETGTSDSQEYIGTESITAYAPLEIEGLDWVIVARIETSEAFAPVADFTRNLVLSTLAILLVVSLLSLVLAQVFTRPIKQLVTAVRGVAAGDLTVQVPQRSRDEFGDLGSAFNDMASSLRIKQELIDEQQIENERLLHTLMPEAMATRYKTGEESIAQEHENVSVVFAELVGFDDYAQSLTPDEEIQQLNLLNRGFDEAAKKVGVETVRTLREGYLASAGLIVPRVDNMRRAVDFAKEMRAVVARFNSQHGTQIELRAGVDAGSVTSGLVARTSLAYDLWGDAVSLAYRVRSVTGEPGIYVSQAVRDRMQDSVVFVEAGSIDLHGTPQRVWRVE